MVIAGNTRNARRVESETGWPRAVHVSKRDLPRNKLRDGNSILPKEQSLHAFSLQSQGRHTSQSLIRALRGLEVSWKSQGFRLAPLEKLPQHPSNATASREHAPSTPSLHGQTRSSFVEARQTTDCARRLQHDRPIVPQTELAHLTLAAPPHSWSRTRRPDPQTRRPVCRPRNAFPRPSPRAPTTPRGT